MYYNNNRDGVEDLINEGVLSDDEVKFAQMLLSDSLTQEELDQVNTDIHNAFNNQ